MRKYLYSPVACEENIQSLDVPVDDAAFVKVRRDAHTGDEKVEDLRVHQIRDLLGAGPCFDTQGMNTLFIKAFVPWTSRYSRSFRLSTFESSFDKPPIPTALNTMLSTACLQTLSHQCVTQLLLLKEVNFLCLSRMNVHI